MRYVENLLLLQHQDVQSKVWTTPSGIDAVFEAVLEVAGGVASSRWLRVWTSPSQDGLVTSMKHGDAKRPPWHPINQCVSLCHPAFGTLTRMDLSDDIATHDHCFSAFPGRMPQSSRRVLSMYCGHKIHADV